MRSASSSPSALGSPPTPNRPRPRPGRHYPGVELVAAIEAGDEERVRELIATDPDVLDARDERGLSPVLAAKYVGQDAIAELLAAAGTVDVFDAAATGRSDELRVILKVQPGAVALRSPDGFTALHYAAFFADGPTVGMLLEAGADPAAVADNPMRVQPLHSAAARRNVEESAAAPRRRSGSERRAAGRLPAPRCGRAEPGRGDGGAAARTRRAHVASSVERQLPEG